MNDGVLYTGLDGEPDGIFGNEGLDKETAEKMREQEHLLKELTPKLQAIIDLIDLEIKSVMSIDRFISATAQREADIRAELQASALYKKYLDTLKTKFVLALNEAKR